ncbi:MAG: tRNA pseudouridine(55) synthase TruB [Bacteroidia bacterium]
MNLRPTDEGLFLIDKPLKWSSYDVIEWLKRNTPYRKLGHAGTLDPLATGLLIVAVDKATRTIPILQAYEKTYVTQLFLGATTPSYDSEFPPENMIQPGVYTQEELTQVLQSFEGEIWQIPPPYSAVHIQGVRAYALARQGKEVSLLARKVWIKHIRLLAYTPPHTLALEVTCGKGTYIRSLARDIGEKLGCGSYVAQLRRVAIGPYHVDRAYPLPDGAPFIRRKKS